MVVLMESTLENHPVSIGERIEVNGHRGTVLFVGPVPPTKGIWLGVDWDNPSRGKHDGTYNGVRYFKARYETSGSLVRLEKVTLGRSIISAIKERYGGDNRELDINTVQEVQRALNAPFLEMVGFDKIAQKQSFGSLSVVGIREHQVNSAGEPGKLGELCPGIKELDLSRNLVNSWTLVAEITSQLPLLKLLDISENRLSHDCDLERLKQGLLNLEYLVLSKVEYTWDDILKCAIMWPHLSRFQASFNRITTLTIPPPNILQDLKILNIEGNNIVEWSEIMKLGHLPKLNSMNISNIGLSRISLPTPNSLFPALKFILLSGNYINNWESISELDKLPMINELKFRDNPILNGLTRESSRQIVIARVSKLKTLNGQEIPDEERRGAEYDYLKNNGKLWLESSQYEEARTTFLISHPRYPELIRKYGEIEQGEIEVKSSALKNRLTKVKLVFGEKMIQKKLPDGMSVQSLCGLAQRLFNTGSSLPALTLISSKNTTLKIPLDNSLKPLSYYSIEEEDKILVSP